LEEACEGTVDGRIIDHLNRWGVTIRYESNSSRGLHLIVFVLNEDLLLKALKALDQATSRDVFKCILFVDHDSPTAAVAGGVYNCYSSDSANCERAWSDDKKKWCSEVKRVHCSTAPPPRPSPSPSTPGPTPPNSGVSRRRRSQPAPSKPSGSCSPQSGATWNLGRVVGSNRPPYVYGGSCPNGGKGVHVYVLDTGVRTTHVDFGGRAVPTLDASTFRPTECKPKDTGCANDADGHGTHVAGAVGGTSYGVAKQATLHAVKVLGDDGMGKESYWVSAIDWVMSSGQRPAVIQMSLGGSGKPGRSAKHAVSEAVAAGIPVMIAAGNADTDACSYSPAGVPDAFTVGATDENNQRAYFSNYGSCVDIMAPGVNIVSAGHTGNSATATKSGTSMACPMVSGAAALLMGENPKLSVSSLQQHLLKNTFSNVISDTQGSPNKLLHVG